MGYHVFLVNRALSEVSQAIANSLRNIQAGQVQAVAFGLRVIQNRTRLFSSALMRCPCSEARHVQSHSPFLVLPT